jgi:type I restriction enzyme S subunit
VDFLDSQRRPVKETDRTAGPYPYYGANGLQGWIDGFLFDEPLLLLAEDGGHFDDPDRGVAYRIEGKSWVNNHAHVLRPKPFMDIRFLCRVLENYDLRPFITGSTRAKLTKKDAERIVIPVPPLDEQRRIAAILDQADDLRRKRREALGRIDSFTQSVFLTMFGDWSSPGFNGKLEPVGAKLDFLTSGSRGWAEYYRESGDLFLRIQNVRHDELDLEDVAYVEPPQTAEAKRTRVEAGDVLLSITADLGRTAVVPKGIGSAFINQHLAILRTSAYEPRYLSAAIASRAGQAAIQRKNREGVKAGLNFDDVRSLEIPAASRTEQQKFAAIAAKIDKLKAHHRAHLARLDALFASLQHRAFRGDLPASSFSRLREKVASRSEVG